MKPTNNTGMIKLIALAAGLVVTCYSDVTTATVVDRGVFEWEVQEESPPSTFVGNVREDLLETQPSTSSRGSGGGMDAQLLKTASFKFLPKPNQDLSVFFIDSDTGVVRTSSVRVDRETYCGVTRQVGAIHTLSLSL